MGGKGLGGLIGLVGMGIGYMVGGSAGAMFGGMIGNAIGQVVAGAAAPKPEGAQQPVVSRQQMIRNTDPVREYVYGSVKKSGCLAYHYTTADNQFFYMAIVLASHPCNSITKIWINEESFSIGEGNLEVDTGFTTTGYTYYKAKTYNQVVGADTIVRSWTDNMWIDYSLGASTVANARFVAETSGNFTSTDAMRNCAVIYIKLKWNPELGTGVPNVAVEMTGKNDIYDTRTLTSGYSTNSALCLRDFIVDTVIGLGVPTAEIDTTYCNTAADICDEPVTLVSGSESRYTCNGVITSAGRLSDGVESFLSSMAGSLLYVNGAFRIIAGKYQTPTITLTDDDIIATIGLSRTGRQDKFNAVRGTFISSEQGWIPTDFPHITNSTYQTSDGERIYKDISLPFTTSMATAQRIAKIDLERNRQDITVSLTISLRQYNIAAGDTIMLTYADFGWTSKVFDVIERSLATHETENGLALCLKLLLRETASTVYTWSAEETTLDPAPNSSLATETVAAMTGMSLDSSESWVERGKNGTIVSRIRVSYTQHSNYFVRGSGRIEIQYKKSLQSVWLISEYADGNSSYGFVTNVDDRVSYDVRIRAISSHGVRSDWTTVTDHVVSGKTSPPPSVTGFEVGSWKGLIRFHWDVLTTVDCWGYEIRYAPAASQFAYKVSTSWSDAIPISRSQQGSGHTSASVPPGTWIFMIKAIDYNGTYSVTQASIGPVAIANNNTVLVTHTENNRWTDTLTNMVRHYTCIVPDDQFLASDYGWETFDEFIPTPVVDCYYTDTEVDLGSDKTVRFWGNIASELGPGSTFGVAEPKIEIAYRASADLTGLSSEATTSLYSTTATYTNIVKHYTNHLIPDSQSLASDVDWEVFDQTVYNPVNTCTFISDLQDFGSAANAFLSVIDGVHTFPDSVGTSDITFYIDTDTGTSPDGIYDEFNTGFYNLRSYRLKAVWTTAGGIFGIESLFMFSSKWREMTIGELTNIRYLTPRIHVNTDLGVYRITEFQYTIDN